MQSKKIINDPVHGFITIPFESTMRLIEHPYFQRLRRIKQLGMTDYVYPGAVHTRFHHALGALHLMIESLRVLIDKGVKITEAECEAACAAILLHDIGHGPFSHALERRIVPLDHEEVGIGLMNKINLEFGHELDRAISIFQGTYEKPFLHQLVSSQLDMDRMDYLARDSFYTGVTEGLVGHARLIKMLHVKEGQLVLEEKAVRSIEKFLHARNFMYWQVYLHKTVLSTEVMLQRLFDRIKEVYLPEDRNLFGNRLADCLEAKQEGQSDELLLAFARLDDSDLWYAMKQLSNHSDYLIQLLARGLTERRLFKLFLHKDAQVCDQMRETRLKSVMNPKLNLKLLDRLVVTGAEKTTFYKSGAEEIRVLTKDGLLKGLSDMIHIEPNTETIMYYVSYPTAEQIKN